MFRRIAARNPAIKIKSGLMLGIGETRDELLDTLADLYDAGVRLLTLGQYLQPSPEQMTVVRYLPAEEFDELGTWPGKWASRKSPAGRSCGRATMPATWRSSAEGKKPRFEPQIEHR